MLKLPRFEQWPCTDRTVNVKQLLVIDANIENGEDELNMMYKLNPSTNVEPVEGFAETR
jgi:hypothetical protein